MFSVSWMNNHARGGASIELSIPWKSTEFSAEFNAQIICRPGYMWVALKLLSEVKPALTHAHTHTHTHSLLKGTKVNATDLETLHKNKST